MDLPPAPARAPRGPLVAGREGAATPGRIRDPFEAFPRRKLWLLALALRGRLEPRR